MKNILTYIIASIWLINGFYCKVLNQVSRHEQIIGEILGFSHSRLFTILIGISEIVMTIWILSKYKPKLNAIIQILIIATMNILEFLLVPNLLLWGKFNILFAFILMLIIYYNEFYLKYNKNA